MSSSSLFPTKPISDDDDETVDSDSDEQPIPSKQSSSFAIKKRKRLTTISRKYDLDGDGELNEAEQAMRNRDVANRGFLTNEEIYDVVQEQLQAKKNAGHMKKLIAGLVCFVVLLAMSNLGTSLAAAFLAKDLEASDDSSAAGSGGSTMRIAATGEIAGAQSTADTYVATEMSDEQLDERRRLVLEEMDADPHSHGHRRDLRACQSSRGRDDKSGCGNGRITFDSSYIPEDEFLVMETKCKQQKNVYLKRKWEDDTKNECICSRGTSVVVKESRKKGSNNNDNDKDEKKKGSNDKNKKTKGSNSKIQGRDREVIIERDDGRTLHADCSGGVCYCGGAVLQGDLGDACRISADECGQQLVCQPSLSNNKSLRSSSSSNYGICMQPTVTMSTVVIERNVGGGYCDAEKGWDACSDGYYCMPEDFDVLTARNGGNGNGGYAGANAHQGVSVVGPSGAIHTGQGGNTNTGGSGGVNARSARSGVGTCVRTVGYGQTCYSDYDCGRENYCDGLGAGGTEAFELHGSSGSIVVAGTAGATSGICRGS